MAFKYSAFLLRRHDQLQELRAAENRKYFPYYCLIGLLVSGVILVPAFVFWITELSRVGGSMVGFSVVLQLISHWFEINPTKSNQSINASLVTVVSAIVAFIGTLLWTFGDQI